MCLFVCVCVCVDFPGLCGALFPLMCDRGYFCFCGLDNELMFVYTVCVCACMWVIECVCMCVCVRERECVCVCLAPMRCLWRASSRARLCSPLQSDVLVVELVCLLGYTVLKETAC